MSVSVPFSLMTDAKGRCLSVFLFWIGPRMFEAMLDFATYTHVQLRTTMTTECVYNCGFYGGSIFLPIMLMRNLTAVKVRFLIWLSNGIGKVVLTLYGFECFCNSLALTSVWMTFCVVDVLDFVTYCLQNMVSRWEVFQLQPKKIYACRRM